MRKFFIRTLYPIGMAPDQCNEDGSVTLSAKLRKFYVIGTWTYSILAAIDAFNKMMELTADEDIARIEVLRAQVQQHNEEFREKYGLNL